MKVEKLLELACAILGTVMIVISLDYLVPNGMWLYLGMLVGGFQLVTMALRSAFK